jgi:hypothetical protein
LRDLPVILNRLTVPGATGQLGILGCAIGCIGVRFKDYATDRRTTIKMRCSDVGRWSDVFLHAPVVAPVPVDGTVKRISRDLDNVCE